GKGKPVTFQLVPLSLLHNYLDGAVKADVIHKTIQNDVLTQAVYFFEEVNEGQQKFNDFCQDVLDNAACLQSQIRVEVKKMKQKIGVEVEKLKGDLAKRLEV